MRILPRQACLLLNMPAFAGHTTERETLASLGSHQANVPVIPIRQCSKSAAFFFAMLWSKRLARIL